MYTPEELVARLAALVPPPPEGEVLPGALGPGAGAGKGADSSNETRPGAGAGAAMPAREPDPALPRVPRARRPYRWAELMRRDFALDVLECPRCHRPLRILAAIHPPDAAGAILECLGLPARPPPVVSARRVVGLFESDTDWSRD